MLRPGHAPEHPSRGDVDPGALGYTRTAPGLREPDFQSGRRLSQFALGQEAGLRARPPERGCPGIVHTARPGRPGTRPGEPEEQPGDQQRRGQQRGITLVRDRPQTRGARLRVKSDGELCGFFLCERKNLNNEKINKVCAKI